MSRVREAIYEAAKSCTMNHGRDSMICVICAADAAERAIAAVTGKCCRPGCGKSVPVAAPWCSVACMDEHTKADAPTT